MHRDTDRSRRLFLTVLAGVSAAACIVVLSVYAGYFMLNGWPPGRRDFARVVVPLLGELALFYCVARWCALRRLSGMGRRWAMVFAVWVLAFGALLVVQCVALLHSNSFLSVLALQNAAEAHLAAKPAQYAWLGLPVAGAIGMGTWLWRLPRVERTHGGRGWPSWVGAAVAIVVVVGFNRTVPVLDGMGALQPGQSPLASLLRTYSDYSRGPEMQGGFRVELEEGAPYPYLKDWVNRTPLPFDGVGRIERPNVIVLFLEGVSARLVEPYGGRFEGLTPGMRAFAGQSMVVDNYFNHTAATHRGLQGQMTSGFPVHGGTEQGDGWDEGRNAEVYARRSYSSLARILGDDGYRSVFLSPHPDRLALNRLLEMLDFDEVLERERITEELLHADKVQPFHKGALTDHDMFLALRRLLERENGDRPLFVGFYNIGTHAFTDVDRHGVKYAKGRNRSLNTLHNLDASLGAFLRWFERSPHAHDTMLVVTSDHAHYPEPPFVAVAGRPYDPFFVDRIPLMIRAPWIDLPPRYDAMDRTSLDFAPTLLHLLGVEGVQNAFVGESIFRPLDPEDSGLRLAPIGRSIYAIHGGRVHPPHAVPESVAAEYERSVAAVRRYYALELRNRIFPRGDVRSSDAAPADRAAK